MKFSGVADTIVTLIAAWLMRYDIHLPTPLQVDWDKLNLTHLDVPRAARKSRSFAISMFLKLLTPVSIAILMFIVTFILADTTATDTDRYSTLINSVKYESIIARHVLQATRHAIAESVSESEAALRLKEADLVNSELTRLHENLAFGADRVTGNTEHDANLDELLVGDACSVLRAISAERAAKCPNFLNQLVTRGLTSVLNALQRRTRLLLQERVTASSISRAGIGKLPTGDVYSIGTVLDAAPMHELVELVQGYIMPIMNRMAQIYLQAGQDRIDSLQTLLIVATVLCVLVSLAFTLLVFNPYLAVVDRNIRHTRATLLLLPEQMLQRMPAVMAMLTSQDNANDMDRRLFCCSPPEDDRIPGR